MRQNSSEIEIVFFHLDIGFEFQVRDKPHQAERVEGDVAKRRIGLNRVRKICAGQGGGHHFTDTLLKHLAHWPGPAI